MAAKNNNANILAQIQAKVKVPKDLKTNRYSYRNVESIYEAVKPILAELDCSLVVSDEIVLIGDRFYIKATATISDSVGGIIGSACAYAREDASSNAMLTPQLTGSTSSYARKYALGGLLLLDDSKDIDSLDNSHNTPLKGDDLGTTKRKVAETLKSFGVSDFSGFFAFAGVNKDDINDLKALLHGDIGGMASAFNSKKGE